MLTLAKKKTSEFTFDDGVYFSFDRDVRPGHVQFFCKTDNEEAESCNLRLFQMMPSAAPADQQKTLNDEGTEQPSAGEVGEEGGKRVLGRSLLATDVTKPMTCKEQLLFKESDRQKS